MAEDGDVGCAQRAAGQFGVVSRAQALEFLSARQIERRLARGLWVRLFPAVYRFVSSARGWRQTLEGLVLWAGSGCALSHESAAALHGLSQFRAGRLVLTVRSHQRAPAGVELHQVERLAFHDVAQVDGLPVTSVPRTLLDLAARTEGKTLRAAVDEALRKRLTTLEALQRVAARSTGRPGVIDLRACLDEVEREGGPTESELERNVLEVLQGAGFPAPQRQTPVRMEGRRRRLDFCFSRQRIVIEADGWKDHSSREAFEADRARDNYLTARGFRVLRWTWRALQDRPGDLLAELAALFNG